MAAKNFDAAMAAVFKHEGGYVDHPADPGGATNLGITRATLAAYRGRPVSRAEVRALTRAEAKAIYKKQYWDTAACDELPSGVDYAVFDYSVNSGPSRSIRTLQVALGVSADGVVGVRTLAAAEDANAGRVVNDICDRRLAFLRRLKTWSTFGRGWERRVEGVRKHALAIAGDLSVKPDVEQPVDPTPKAPEPPPVPPKKSKSLWGILVSQLGGIAGLAWLTDINSWPQVAAIALLLIALGIGLWLVLSGRVDLKRWFEIGEEAA